MLNDEIKKSIYYKYAEDVISGNKIAGKYIILAAERFIRDINSNKFVFKPKEVMRCIKFCQLFKHFSGKSSGSKFILEDWQVFTIANLFGFYKVDEDTGDEVRRYNVAYIQIARKNGKSFFAAALSLYAMMADGEQDPQVVFLATTREQAGIAFNMSKVLAKQLDINSKLLKYTKSEIRFRTKPGMFKVLASDASKLDGYGPSFAILDEVHEYRDDSIFEVIRSGQGFRNSPLILQITTAGFNKRSYCYETRGLGVEILEQKKVDDSYFFLIFELDKDDDIEVEDNWFKCSPNLGVTVNKSKYRDYLQKMKNSPSLKPSILTKNFNMFVDSFTTWIDSSYVKAAMKKIEWEEFRGREVYIGVDLSMTRDLTSVSFMYIDDNSIPVFKSISYLPEKTREENIDYFIEQCFRRGEIIETEGNVVDYEYIIRDIEKLVVDYDLDVRTIAYDRFNSTQWAIKMTELGYDLFDFNQGVGSFNRPTKDFERLVMMGDMIIDSSELTSLCISSVTLRTDMHGNIKPDKSKSTYKIDIVISMLQALGAYLIKGDGNFAIFNMN